MINFDSPPPVALTIAGSDPSGGAGLQADLKTFAAHGVHGLSAVTCSTAQIPGEVADVAPLEPAHLASQLALLFPAYPIAAVKTGMLFSTALMEVVVAALNDAAPGLPLVVDPVMVASSGDPLLEEEAIDYYRSVLLPRASLFTPNLDEAAVLLDVDSITRDDFESAAQELYKSHGVPVLLKGGHLCGDEALDILATDAGLERFSAPFVKDVSTHGTGCTYSAAIAAGVATGLDLAAAVKGAKRYVTAAIAGSHRWANGVEVLDHFAAIPDSGA